MELNDKRTTLTSIHTFVDLYPLTIHPDSCVTDAVALMNGERKNNLYNFTARESLAYKKDTQELNSCVLVVENNKLLGIFTLRDIVKTIGLGLDLSNTKIDVVMTKQPITLAESDLSNIYKITSIFKDDQISHLPIVDDQGNLKGIVTESLLLEELTRRISQDVEIKQELEQTIEELLIVEEEISQKQEELLDARQIAELERQRYYNLFEFTPYGYLITDKFGIIQEANQAASNLLSIQQKYLVGKPMTMFIVKDKRDKLICQLAASEEIPEIEVNLKPRIGRPFPASIKITGIYGLQGEKIGWSWLIFDSEQGKKIQADVQLSREELEQIVAERTAELVITNQSLQREIKERQETEAALRESEGIFRQFGENIQANIWICTKDYSQIFYVNPAYEKIWGRSCQSLRDNPTSWIDAIYPEERDQILETIEKYHQQDQRANLEYRIIHIEPKLQDVKVQAVLSKPYFANDLLINLHKVIGL